MQHFGVCKKRAFGIPMPLPELLNDKYRQAVRIMKITAFILLVCTLHVSAGGFSQSITLSEKEAPLTKVFKAIEKQTDYIFFYNTEWVKKAEKVNVEVKNMQLQQVLEMLFKNQPITYSITGKMITVFPKKDDEQASPNQNLTSPPLDIHGKVVDENGKPVAGVTITVKGTKKETITNENGEFSFTGVESNALITFSSINMEPFTINVSGRSEILAKLKTKTSELDEVQIVAYGQTTKRFQTGNVTTIKATDIEKQPVSNPLLALQGRVPGLFITQTNGLPGGGVTVRIQGKNSINYGNDPLIVIDGVPFFSQLPSTGSDLILGSSGGLTGTNSAGSPLSYLNPNDIESIDILKDADATAIYGSRAANGAILIITKKGSSGSLKFDVNLQQGWGTVANKWEMLNTEQYLEMRNEALKNDNLTADPNYDYDLTLWDQTRYTEWQKTLIGGTAEYTNVNASVAGGTANMQYLVSATYNKQTTVFPGGFKDKKGSVHFNIASSSANQKFRLQFSGSYMLDDNRLLSSDLTQSAVLLEPNAPALYNDDGSLNWAPNAFGYSTWVNPLAELTRKYNNKTNSLISNATLSYQLLNGLDVRSSLGYTRLQTEDFMAQPLIYYKPEERAFSPRFGQYGNRDMNSWIFEPQIAYKKSIGHGKIDVLLGGTIQQSNSNSRTVSAIGFNSDEVLENINAATQLFPGGQYSVQYKYAALFSRINFNLSDRYVVNLTGRRDGTSRFGAKNLFHNFGSLGGAWIFSEEKFMQTVKWLSFGKLRASYGTTGSDQIGDYAYMSIYNYMGSSGLPYQNTTGIYAEGLPNPYLEWEETRKLQMGIELGFFSDRILLTGTHAINRSSNQLLSYSLPSITGNFGILRNFPATVENKSWEISFTSTNLKNSSFEWNTSVNVTVPKNKLVAFPDLSTSTYKNSLIIGEPITVRKEYSFQGVDPATGVYQFLNNKGVLTTSPDYTTDRIVLLNTLPKFYGGILNKITYKGFELNFLIQFVKQLGVNYRFNNGLLWPGRYMAGASNQSEAVLNNWQKPGDLADIAKYSTSTSYSLGDAAFTDASYVRLKNLSISYLLPEKWRRSAHLRNCTIYFQGQNLWTITDWKGLDPETQSVSSLPPLQVWTVGIQLGF